MFEWKIEGTSYWSITNTDTRVFTNVKMFAADPWHTAVDGSMRGLTVKTSVDNTATKVDNVKGEVDKILTILNGRQPMNIFYD